MNIIISLYNHWSQQILSGIKPLEFRTKLPKDIKIGDTIYLYETRKHDGAGAIVGECKLNGIINVLNEKGEWPVCGSYPFIDFYCEHIKCDKDCAEQYRKVKEEFLNKFERYKHGYIIDFAFSEKELDHIRKNGTPIDLMSITDFKELNILLNEIEKSHKIICECDNWLTKIGFYNECLESNYKYAYVLSNVKKYETPIPLTNFKDQKGNTISKAPQSWMYTLS